MAQWGQQPYPPQGGPPQPYGQQQQQFHQPPPFPPPQQGYGPPPGQFQPPPQGYGNAGGYGAPPPGQYGYGGPPPPAPPSPGYFPGQQSHLDMSRAADDLRAAMKGFGTNEDALIRILAPLGPLEINSVKAAFHARHHRDLMKDIHSETSGNFRELLLGICRGPLDHDCHVLHDAVNRIGTKETALDDVLLARSNADLNAIKTHYQHTYHRTAEADVKADLSLKTERMFDMVLAARRNEDSSPVIPQHTDTDVRDIYNATEGRAGTDQIIVSSILTSRSNGQLRAIAQTYHQRYGRSLADCIRKEFSGHMQDALLHIVLTAEDPAKHDADMLEDSMKGLGTKDSTLIRRVIAIHWDRNRLQQCKAAYRHFHRRELADRIRDETSGDYRKLLVIFEV